MVDLLYPGRPGSPIRRRRTRARGRCRAGLQTRWGGRGNAPARPHLGGGCASRLPPPRPWKRPSETAPAAPARRPTLSSNYPRPRGAALGHRERRWARAGCGAGDDRDVNHCPSRASSDRQMAPVASACSIQGTTSSSIWSSEVVASKASTSGPFPQRGPGAARRADTADPKRVGREHARRGCASRSTPPTRGPS